MGMIFKKCEIWKIYHTEYGPFLANDWLKQKKVGGSWANIVMQVLSVNVKGHRPVIVKRAVIGSKGGWKLSTMFLSCKVFHDLSIIKLGNILYLLDGLIFAVFLK